MSYPHLASALPVLSWGSAPAISVEDFLRQCDDSLSPEDRQVLGEALDVYNLPFTVEEPDELPFHTEWGRSLTELFAQFRREIGELRQVLREGHAHKSAFFPTEVIEPSNPLEGQKALLQTLWNLLQDREQGVWWSTLPGIVWYGVRLKILSRVHAYDTEVGKQVFAELVSRPRRQGGAA